MNALATWSGVPGDAGHPGPLSDIAAILGVPLVEVAPLPPALPAMARDCANLTDDDRENGRKLDAWWSPSRLDAGTLHLGAGQSDDAKEHALDLRALAGFSFVYDAGGDRANSDEAAPVVQCHLGREVDSKPAESFARRITHRLVSWLKSLFARVRP